MKLWLIKIGKAWNVLRRDGLFRGLKRIWSAFWLQYQKVEPGDILYITNGVGDSARYRARHVPEELRFHGFRASTTLQSNPVLESYADEFQVFVFHRVLATERMRNFFSILKQKGKIVLFEADDLIYDPEYLHLMDYYKNINALEKKFYEHGVGGEFLRDPYITHATTTTTYLQGKLEAEGKRVFLVTNKLSEEDVSWAEEILAQKKEKSDECIYLSYLSGTPSHNKDFATINKPLQKILTEFPLVRLVLMGPLDTDDALHAYASQIIRIPYMDRHKYFEKVAEMDINLAPLEIGNAYCESKSELKFFEAGILAVPTVAAATQTFREAVADGVDGFVAETEEEWYEKMRTLITDEAKRREMGKSARQTALIRYTTKQGNSPEYYEFLKQQSSNQ